MILPTHEAARTGPDSMRFTLHLDPADAAFQGHFPDQPVLAGVLQLDWVMHLAEAHLGVSQRAACDFKVKFRRLIPPTPALVLLLTLDRARGRLAFEYRLDGETASLGDVALAPS